MIQRMLKITSIEEVKTAKNGRPYRVVRFMPFNMLGDGTRVFSNSGLGTRTIFAAFKDQDGNDFKADGLWTSIQSQEAGVNSVVGGYIAKVSAYPYQIEGGAAEAKSFSTVIFDNENELDYCNKQLAPYYSCVVVDGVLTAPQQLQKPVNATAGIGHTADLP